MTHPASVRSIRRLARPQRGVALLLVLGVVAVASILSWAMLSSASLRAQLDTNVRDAIEAQYLADSGISYAMYYLRYPAKSPVALTAGPYNNHYGGQSNLQMWGDAGGFVDVVVTNTAKDTFLIRSSALVHGTLQTSEAEVSLLTVGYVVDSAAAFGGPIQLPNTVFISGLVSTAGTITNTVGNVLSLLGGSPVVVETDAVPAFATLKLVTETANTASTGGTDRTYILDGTTYVAEKAPSTITGTLQTARPTLNPANVWYSESNVVLNGATINGTLIVRAGTDLELQGTNTINVSNQGLPALVVGKELKFKHASLKPANLNVQGVAWIGDKIGASGSTILATGSTIQGALLMGSTAPRIDAGAGFISITKTAAVAQTTLTDATNISGITVNRWTRL